MSTASEQLPFIGHRSINLLSDETEDSTEREANICHVVDWTDGDGGKELTLYHFKCRHSISIWVREQRHICNFNTFLIIKEHLLIVISLFFFNEGASYILLEILRTAIYLLPLQSVHIHQYEKIFWCFLDKREYRILYRSILVMTVASMQ